MNRPAVDAVAREVAQEKAEALGLAGKKLEEALRALHELDAASDTGDARRRELVARAAERVTSLLVQREAYGFADPSFLLAHYDVPAEVVARLGIRVVT
ncbi:MAG TPA: DUF6665 family protein [Gammaproteobacteria bacterium]|nr:DUF6665 family protein [Gammaproteobacteria bacterium]